MTNVLHNYIINPLEQYVTQQITKKYGFNEGRYNEHDRILLENSYDLMVHKYDNPVDIKDDADLFTFDSSTYFNAITKTIFCLFD